MHIILLILKIIGMILLGILGLILLILLLLLLSPFGYSATGCYHSDGNKKLLGNFHYLFHGLKLDVMWNGEKVKYRVKLLGFTLKKGASGLGDADQAKERPAGEEEFFHETLLEPETGAGNELTQSSPFGEDLQDSSGVHPEAAGMEQDAADGNWFQSEAAGMTGEGNPDSETWNWTESEAGIDQEEGNEKQGILDKLRNLVEKAEKAYELISQPSMVKMRNRVLKRLFKLLKHVLPRDLNVKGEFGLKDPALMGKIMEVYAFLYAFWGDHFEISTDFEREHIDVKGRIRGHLVPAYLLHQIIWMGLAILWQKDVRKFIFGKLFHK